MKYKKVIHKCMSTLLFKFYPVSGLDKQGNPPGLGHRHSHQDAAPARGGEQVSEKVLELLLPLRVPMREQQPRAGLHRKCPSVPSNHQPSESAPITASDGPEPTDPSSGRAKPEHRQDHRSARSSTVPANATDHTGAGPGRRQTPRR